MKNFFFKIILLSLFLVFFSFTMHKFYVSIYQINYNKKENRIEITSRIFIDDLDAVLEKNYKKKIEIGTSKETPSDIDLFQKYITQHFILKINGQKKSYSYISKEIDGHELVCYFKINKIEKIKTLEVENSALFELNQEQQNIMQINVFGKKQSLTLTHKKTSGIVK